MRCGKTNEIWHRRLGHLNFQALPSIEKIVKGLPNLKPKHEGICKGCVLGKNLKTPFHHSEHKSKSILELIHTDLCGPMSVTSLGEYSYCIIYVHNYFGKTWIYFLKL